MVQNHCDKTTTNNDETSTKRQSRSTAAKTTSAIPSKAKLKKALMAMEDAEFSRTIAMFQSTFEEVEQSRIQEREKREIEQEKIKAALDALACDGIDSTRVQNFIVRKKA